MSSAVPAIECDGLRVVRGGVAVLSSFTAQIASGRITGLLGPSGSGKTTLIRSIAGVQQVAGGTVTVLGLPAGSVELRHRVAYMTQDASVYADLTVAQNVNYFAKILGAPTADVDRVIAAVGLTGREGDRVGRLSGGQRSRVSLAVALLGTPEVLVLDEPTVGLDPVLRRDLWQLFGELAETGLTLVVSSHVMDEASRCDDLMLLRDGDLLANDTVPAILEATGTSDIESAFLYLVQAKP